MHTAQGEQHDVLFATLTAALPALEHCCADPWWLIGSGALRIAGVPDIAVHDVDVLSSDADAARLLAHWREQLDPAYVPERHSLFRSRFGRVLGFALPLEVMGNLELRRDGEWGRVVPNDRGYVDWRGLRVPVPSLSAQCVILQAFARRKDLAKVEVLQQFLRG